MVTKQELETIRSKAPLMSEGSLSPYQVSNMSKREKQEWDKNRAIRFKAEEEFKKQNRTIEEIKKEEVGEKIKKLESRESQINSYLNTIKDLPQMKSKRENGLKLGYRLHTEELEKVQLELKKLKGGLN